MSSIAAERIVGVLGGMGPEATADYYVKLIRNTPIEREQDHIHVIIDSNPKIPSRSEAIISGQTAEVMRMLQHGARMLERAGAGMIVMPCNTAHVFLPDICAAVGVPVLDMVKETARAVRSALPHARRVGVLATWGTIRSRLYQDALRGLGLEAVTADEHEERRVAQAIEAIKVGHLLGEARDELAAVARQLVALGAQAIIAGCTEVPLVLRKQNVAVPLFDSTEILAGATVRWAMEYRLPARATVIPNLCPRCYDDSGRDRGVMRQFGEGSTESTVPPAVVDSHVHVWELDSEAFPWQPQLGVTATTAEPASGLVAGMHDAWVDGAVVVQSSVYGFDHRYLMHVLASEPERFRGVALVDPMNPSTASLMNDMARTGRITGVRMIPLRADRDWFGSCAQPIWETAAEARLAVTFLAGPAHFDEIGRWARRYRDVAVVVDHFGSPDLSGGKPPCVIDGLLQLAELPNCHIKMSGLGAMSGVDFPYRDTWSFALQAVGAFGAGRVMWGSDFPWLRQYRSTLRQSRVAAEMALADLSDQDLDEIMGGTARRVFRFPDSWETGRA